MHAVRSMSPQEYAALRDAGQPHLLIDVREPWEFQISRLLDAKLMPLGEIYEWAPTLDREATYVVMCHHGIRSMTACHMLSSMGFRDVVNLDGGIDAWSYAVDRSTPRY
jgi:rhodanese-related sulfurtransferase